MKEVIIKYNKGTILLHDNKTTYFGQNALFFLDIFNENNLSSCEDRLKYIKKNLQGAIIIDKYGK